MSRRWTGCVTLIVWLSSSACGSGSETEIFGSAGASASPSPTSSGGSGGSGGSAGVEFAPRPMGGWGAGGGPPIADGGAAGAIADAGPTPIAPVQRPSDAGTLGPGFVACGLLGVCAPGSECCWVPPTVLLPFPTSCFPPGFCGVNAAISVRCDDGSDCPANTVCCGQLTGTTPTGSGCVDSCSGQDTYQLCRLDGECPAGKSCLPIAGADGFSGCQ